MTASPQRDALAAAADRFGLELSPRDAGRLCQWLDLLLHWNRRINLTGARTLEALVDPHVVDSLALLPHLPSGTRSLADVGAGAGFPAVVLALLRPTLHVVALEPNHKKHAFLLATKREIALPNLDPRAERLEAHLARQGFAPYDAAVSRASWPLPEWLALGAPLVRPGGLLLGMEGRVRHELPEGAERHDYSTAGTTRAIVALRLPMPPVAPAPL